MKYGLVLTTHGPAPHLDDTLQSFYRWVSPAPVFRYAVVDGHGSLSPPIRGQTEAWTVLQAHDQYGFCKTVQSAWGRAAAMCADHDLDYVFWLENDFRFLRPIDLTQAALTLSENPKVAQMSFLRQPVNEREIAAGGVLDALPPDMYVRRQGWVDQTAYFTTNPSLIPASVLELGFPDGPECEGKMGVRLRDAGYTFGVWGDGSTWVEHMGERSHEGKGY